MPGLTDALPGPYKSLRKAAFCAAAVILGLAFFAARAYAYTIGSRSSGCWEILPTDEVSAVSKAGLPEE